MVVSVSVSRIWMDFILKELCNGLLLNNIFAIKLGIKLSQQVNLHFWTIWRWVVQTTIARDGVKCQLES